MRRIHLCGETLPHPGHVCAFFDSRDQKYDILVPFLTDALAAGDEVVNIVDAADRTAHVDTLVERGVAVPAALTSGQFNVFTSEETYLRGGEETLPRLLDFLRQTLERSKQENHCVRTWGEMNWVGRGLLPIRDVLTYEARVNQFLPDFECTLVCAYDLAQTSSLVLADILATHPWAIIKGRLRKNPYYVPTPEYLSMLSTRPN